MGNDLRNFRPAYLKLQEDLERLSRMLKPSYLNLHEQMERAFEPIRKQHLDIARSIEVSRLTSAHFAEIAQANQRWQDLIAQATASTRLFGDLTQIHQTWTDTMKPIQDSGAQLQASAKLSLGNVSYQLTIAESLFAGMNFEALERTAASSALAFVQSQDLIGGVTGTYQKLADSIRMLPDITRLPAFALPGATREVFVTGYAARTIYIPDESYREPEASELIDEIEHETSGCIALLRALDPTLATPYIGARDALQGRNADRARHILSSLRELWNHLLRRLAPDDDVIAWVPSNDRELLHEGRPTRRARVLYVCRTVNFEPLTDFVVQDTRALVKLLDFFNRVHEIELELTDEQLRALVLRTDSWLSYILQISGTRS